MSRFRQPEPLFGEVPRHPMWDPPAPDTKPVQRALFAKIAEVLVPFDGRPNSGPVILYCQLVHLACTTFTGNPLNLIGLIVNLRVNTANKAPSFAPVITRLSEQFVQAVIEEANL